MIIFLQVVLVVLKAVGVVSWPWLVVLIPLWIGLGLTLIPFVFAAIVATVLWILAWRDRK